MSRFSPTVLPDAGPNFQSLLAQAIGAVRDEQNRRSAEKDREFARNAALFQIHRQGGRFFDEAPERELAPEEDIFHGAAINPRVQATPDPLTARPALGGRRDMSFRGIPGVPGSGEDAPPLAQAIAGARGALNGEAGRPIALPNQFVPELGGFSPRAIFAPPAPKVRVRDPRYEHVSGNLYFDTEHQDDAERAREWQLEDRRADEDRLAARRAELLAALSGLGHVTPQQATSIAAGAPADVVFRRTPEQELETFENQERIRARYRHDPGDTRREAARENRLRNIAQVRIANMLATGADRSRVAQAMGAYPDLQGYWTFDDIVAAERTQAEPMLERDIAAALAEGETPDEILEGLEEAGAGWETMEAARRILEGRLRGGR